MTSETPNLHFSKNLNISKTKQDIKKLKTVLRSSRNVVLLRLKLATTTTLRKMCAGESRNKAEAAQ